jgi:hypothetical protein
LLAFHVQETIEKLGFSYRKNMGRSIIEFEISSPCRMFVTIEDLTREQLGYPFRSRLRVESAIELQRLIPSTGSEEELRKHASAFVRGLRDSLPKEPWIGIGLRAQSEKANWERLADI